VRPPIEVSETIVFPSDEASLVSQLAAFDPESVAGDPRSLLHVNL
jgi:hypothetical protein